MNKSSLVLAGLVAMLMVASLGAFDCGAALPAMPVVTISPLSATVQAGGGQQQFTATVTNVGNSAVVWKVDGQLNGNANAGTITQAGLYSAPSAVPSGGTVTVQAMSVANDNVSASAVIKLIAPVTLTLTPAAATVKPGGTVQFSVVVNNAANTNVTWAVDGASGGSAIDGTISTTGLYTAPASFSGLGQVTVTATSVADPGVSAQAVIALGQTVAININPTTATVATGQTADFTASVAGASDTSVTWSVAGVGGGNATVGTMDALGVFTAPARVPSPATETITATSNADATKSASAQVTIVQPVAVTISPTSAQVTLGATQNFTAAVANSTNLAVTWSVNSINGGNLTLGTISSSGVYTAPAAMPGSTTVTVTATSLADTSKAASAAVTLIAPLTVTVSPTSATVNLGATQAFSATVTGGSGSNTAVTWSVNELTGGTSAVGMISASGLFTAPATLPKNPVETVTATSQADATKSASAQVTLQVPPLAFTLTPASSTLTLGKAQTGTITLQLSLAAGFTTPVTLSVAGQPVNVSTTVSPATATASGTITLSVHTASISLAASGVPITLTATSEDGSGNTITQTATVLLSITGWAGQVSTLAGTPGGPGFEDGTGAQDELYPLGLTSDGAQTLFFADKAGTALRQYSLTNQTTTTLIGSPYSYTIGNGGGTAYDPDNQTIYVADTDRERIEAYTLGTGDSLSVLAGGDVAGHSDGVAASASFDGPNGLAISSDHKTLYVADSGNQLIRAIDIATGTVTTIAGQLDRYSSQDGVGIKATFCDPTGLALDAAGANLLISDQCSYKIRELNVASGQVTTVAGSGAQTTLAELESGNLGDGDALQATFYSLGGLATDPHAGTDIVYIADDNAIRALTLGSHPQVYTVAGGAAAGATDGGGTTARFYQPAGITAIADAAGTGTTSLFVADSLNGLLRRIDITDPITATSDSTIAATVSTLAGQPPHRGHTDGAGTGSDYSGTSTALFDQPEGIITDGKIAFVADSNNGAIREINLATTQVTTIAGPGLGFNPGTVPANQASFYENAGLAFDPSHNILYLTDTGNATIRKLDLSASTVTTITGTNAHYGYADGPEASALFNHPFGILISPDGTKLYIADTGNDRIRMIDLTAAMVSTIAGNGTHGDTDGPAMSATFSEPNGLAWDVPGRSLFISDFETADIRLLDLATGAVTTVVGMNHVCGNTDGPAAVASLCDPAFIASDGNSLFWGDSHMGLLRVMDLTTQQVYTLAGTPGIRHMADGDFTEVKGKLNGPVNYNYDFGIALAPDGSFILVTNKNENTVRIIH
ncbi:MAG: hypothetical protein ACRD1C_10015 [Terriglobales bacterium]